MSRRDSSCPCVCFVNDLGHLMELRRAFSFILIEDALSATMADSAMSGFHRAMCNEPNAPASMHNLRRTNFSYADSSV